jgi:hypothetical protein
LQQICRFKIRDYIRSAIEKEDPTYYQVKREKSTFNPNLNKNKVAESHDRDNGESYYSDSELDSISDDGGNDSNAALPRINRFFTLDPVVYNNNSHETPNYIENRSELRMLAYGNYTI